MSREEEPVNRRAAPRYSCAGDAEIVVPGCGLRFPGRIANLSTGGCLIEARCSLERGTSVELWMVAEGMPLRVPANLIVRRNDGVGFRFGQIGARRLDQIRALIAELEAEAIKENPAPPEESGMDNC